MEWWSGGVARFWGGFDGTVPQRTRRDSRPVKLRRSVIFIVTDTHAR
jgi:hypothetical protein